MSEVVAYGDIGQRGTTIRVPRHAALNACVQTHWLGDWDVQSSEIQIPCSGIRDVITIISSTYPELQSRRARVVEFPVVGYEVNGGRLGGRVHYWKFRVVPFIWYVNSGHDCGNAVCARNCVGVLGEQGGGGKCKNDGKQMSFHIHFLFLMKG